jgi:hypothetical protein
MRERTSSPSGSYNKRVSGTCLTMKVHKPYMTENETDMNDVKASGWEGEGLQHINLLVAKITRQGPGDVPKKSCGSP